MIPSSIMILFSTSLSIMKVFLHNLLLAHSFLRLLIRSSCSCSVFMVSSVTGISTGRSTCTGVSCVIFIPDTGDVSLVSPTKHSSMITEVCTVGRPVLEWYISKLLTCFFGFELDTVIYFNQSRKGISEHI